MGALAIFLETQCFVLIIQDVKSLATFPQGEKNIVWKAMTVICVTLKTCKSIIENRSEKIVKLKMLLL